MTNQFMIIIQIITSNILEFIFVDDYNLLFIQQLMDNIRYCSIQGHENGNTRHICIYKGCKQSQRWVCSHCIMNDLHKHGQSNKDHIMNLQQFLEYITKLTQPYLDWNIKQKNVLLDCVSILIKSIQKITQFVQKLQEDYIRINVSKNIQEIQQIIHTTKNNFHLLQNDQINKVLNINISNLKTDYKTSQDLLKQAISYYQELQSMIQILSKQQNTQYKEQNQQFDRILKTQFSQIVVSQNIDQQYTSYISYKSDDIKRTVQISNDERYLVIGGDDRRLQIIGLENKQNLRCLALQEYVMICRFTIDSKNLLCGSRDGELCCYELNNYKEIYKSTVHSQQINDIVPIDNDQIITCSIDKSIIVTDIKDNKQVLQIQNAHAGYIKGLDYDQLRDIIGSCSDDNSIKLFNRNDGKQLIEQQNAHKNQVFQIQFLTTENNLVSSGCNDLVLWQIDYGQSQLNRLNVLNQSHYNFTSVCNNTKIVLICKDSVQILDNTLNIIDTANHDIKNFGYYTKIRQVQSANYIIIPGQYQVQIVKKI
ncbi:hypothetical protein pb186bvf_015304 [Paramecium bursaria]